MNKDEAQELLRGVNKDLLGVKKNAEGNHKEIVEEKVKELREKIDESLSDEEGWGEIKFLLNKDVKGSLEELKNKIVELEEVSVSIPVIMTTNTEELEELKLKYETEKKMWEETERKRNEYKGELEN